MGCNFTDGCGDGASDLKWCTSTVGGLEEVDQCYFSPKLLRWLGLREDLCYFISGVSGKGWTLAWNRRGSLHGILEI